MEVIIGIYAIPDVSRDKYPGLIHDHNMTVIRDGQIETYLHQERISRVKYDSSLQLSLESVARELKLADEKKVCFVFTDHEVGRAMLSENGIIRFEAPFSASLQSQPEKAQLYWFGEWVEAYVINHELAHLYSCIPFYGMFKENSLLVHFDGGASKSNFSAWTYKQGKIQLHEAHYDLKWLSSLFNANALVFSIVRANMRHQNAVPGKFMGLEAFGSYSLEIEEWLRENDFFSDCWKNKKKFFQSVKEKFNHELNHIDNKSKFIQDISATIHELFIRESLNVFQRIQSETKTEQLYYSGGSALNIKLNARILASRLFNDIYIPPCTNDSGLSLGAAVAGVILKKGKLSETSPYLNNYKLNADNFSFSKQDIVDTASLIAEGKVIGICNGYGEIGPRALGNRSIIARADRKQLANKISQDIKKREWYRPIAPMILSKYFKYFTGQAKHPAIAKYMLSEFKILLERKAEIEGCVHKDGTARVQVIEDRSFNPFIFELLHELDERHAIKAIINTSFNQQGEPIVHTTQQAIDSAEKMSLDALVINGKLKIL